MKIRYSTNKVYIVGPMPSQEIENLPITEINSVISLLKFEFSSYYNVGVINLRKEPLLEISILGSTNDKQLEKKYNEKKCEEIFKAVLSKLVLFIKDKRTIITAQDYSFRLSLSYNKIEPSNEIVQLTNEIREIAQEINSLNTILKDKKDLSKKLYAPLLIKFVVEDPSISDEVKKIVLESLSKKL